MTWNQVREMDASPYIEVGAHTDTHSILSELGDSAAVEEISRSKKELQAQLGREIDLFAYPNGQGWDISTAALKAVCNLGFLGACSTFCRTTQKPAERYLINRVIVSGLDNVETLRLKLAGNYDYVYFFQRSKALIDWSIQRRGIWN